MSARREALAAAAEALVGVAFRLHGRDPARGLDCVGLVAAALRAVGREPFPPAGYGLRQHALGGHLAAAARSGLEPTFAPLAAGDVVLVHAGPAQHHLLVTTRRGGFVHAHAGLRRVVISPPPLPWPHLRRWRLKD